LKKSLSRAKERKMKKEFLALALRIDIFTVFRREKYPIMAFDHEKTKNFKVK